jgi:hypothetical protein
VSITIATLQSLLSKVLPAVLSLLVFFFDPNQAKLMLALMALMAFDTFAGGYYHYNLGQHSKKIFFKGFFAKFFKYFGALAGARMLEYFLIGVPHAQDIDTYFLTFLAIIEFKSFYTWLHKFGLNLPMPPKLQSLLVDEKKSTKKAK